MVHNIEWRVDSVCVGSQECYDRTGDDVIQLCPVIGQLGDRVNITLPPQQAGLYQLQPVIGEYMSITVAP